MRRFLLAAILTFLLAPLAAAANIERVVSPQGIEAWLIEDHSNQLISVTIGFHGGSASDPKGKQGLARLAAALLDEGAAASLARPCFPLGSVAEPPWKPMVTEIS